MELPLHFLAALITCDSYEMIRSNLTSAFRMIRAVLPHYLERQQGIIVNVSSIAGLVGMPYMTAYSASKAGIVALIRSTAAEYSRLGIRCNCICPGTIKTPMTKSFLNGPRREQSAASSNLLGHIGKPREIAKSIFFLGSEESSFLTGSVLTADGGYTAF